MGNQFHNRVAWLINNVSGNIYSDFLKGWVLTSCMPTEKGNRGQKSMHP